MSSEFKERDWVTQMKSCSGAIEGEVYQLEWNEGEDCLSTVSEDGDILCSCEGYWKLFKKATPLESMPFFKETGITKWLEKTLTPVKCYGGKQVFKDL